MVLNPSSSSVTASSSEEGNLKMFVLKRDGRKEPVMFDKITSRIQKLCYGLNMDYIDATSITLKVINGLYSGVTTVELDDLAAGTAAMLSNDHPDYAILAARIEVSNLHKETKKSFSDVVYDLHSAGNKNYSTHSKMDDKFLAVVQNHEEILNSSIIYDRDFSFSYFGIKILEKEYLKKIDGKTVERPQHMFMRVAVAIHGEDIDAVIKTYNLLSLKWYTHSDSTLRNAGFSKPQLLSACCMTMKSDSIEGIYSTVKEFGLLSRSGLTVGLNIHCIRAKGSYIAGTNGNSNGIMPMLRVYDGTACGSHHGGKKESGALTIYLEPWHADIFDFLTLKRLSGKEEQRARHLSYALWMPDLFMRRVTENSDWCLMCPHDSDQLQDVWGEEFEEKYLKFEREGRFARKVKARQVWDAIYDSQMETGGPMMLYKDNCNRKSNLKNIGTIYSSSHTGELMTLTNSKQIPACSSGTVCLDMYVKADKSFDFPKLKEDVKVITVTLNKMLDVTVYRRKESDGRSLRNRPIAVGVQGLSDAFILMRYPFEGEEARLLNKQIFETIYYAAIESSCELAEELGPYEDYEGSPISQGTFQHDMWNVTPTSLHDWTSLRQKVSAAGVRNSLLIACLPTADTAQIYECNEATEAHLSNLKKISVFEGSVKVINPRLLKDLMELGLWDDEMEDEIRNNEGSIQNLEGIPSSVKMLYKTVWEISQKAVVELALDRGAFIDQSQALKVRITDPSYGKITSLHFDTWRSGLKTGTVSIETRQSSGKSTPTAPTSSAAPVSKEQSVSNGTEEESVSNGNLADMVCSLENKDDRLMCGS